LRICVADSCRVSASVYFGKRSVTMDEVRLPSSHSLERVNTAEHHRLWRV